LTIKSTSHTFRPRGSRERLIDATFYSRLLVSTSGSRPARAEQRPACL